MVWPGRTECRRAHGTGRFVPWSVPFHGWLPHLELDGHGLARCRNRQRGDRTSPKPGGILRGATWRRVALHRWRAGLAALERHRPRRFLSDRAAYFAGRPGSLVRLVPPARCFIYCVRPISVKIVRFGGGLQWLNLKHGDFYYFPCLLWRLRLLFLPCRRPKPRRLHRQAITIPGTISAFLAVLRFSSFIRAATPGFTSSIRARFSACGSPRISGNTSDSKKDSPSPRTAWNCSRTRPRIGSRRVSTTSSSTPTGCSTSPGGNRRSGPLPR